MSTIATETEETIVENEPSLRRRVWALAWPVIGENFLQTMLGIVDTILVASLGAAALAGVGSAQQVMFFVISALSALSVGSAVLVAQAVGSREWPRASRYAQQSILWSVVLGIPLALLGVFWAEGVVAIFGLEPDVARISAEYLRVTMGTAVVLTTFTIGSGVLRGANDSRTPMLITALANVVNIALTYAMIYGKWGLPAMGAVGSAWATFISRFLALSILLIVLWRGRNGVTIRGLRGWLPDLDVARQVMSMGVPAALEQILISAGFLLQTVVVAQLGTSTLAAHRILFNAMSLSFLPGVGFGLAATSLVGQYIGAQQRNNGIIAARIANMWALMWMGGMGILSAIFAPQIIGLYSDDPNVITIGTNGLRVMALVQPMWSFILVQSGALRGMGNTRYPLLVNATGIWGAVLMGALFTNVFSTGLVMVWTAFFITGAPMAYALWRQFGRDMSRGPVPAAL